MAVNQKSVFASEHTTFGGKLFKPGEEMSGRVKEDYAIRSALESGVATDSPAEAKRAAEQERERRADVDRQIAERSDKRESERPDVPNLVRLPDGTYARAE